MSGDDIRDAAVSPPLSPDSWAHRNKAHFSASPGTVGHVARCYHAAMEEKVVGPLSQQLMSEANESKAEALILAERGHALFHQAALDRQRRTLEEQHHRHRAELEAQLHAAQQRELASQQREAALQQQVAHMQNRIDELQQTQGRVPHTADVSTQSAQHTVSNSVQTEARTVSTACAQTTLVAPLAAVVSVETFPQLGSAGTKTEQLAAPARGADRPAGQAVVCGHAHHTEEQDGRHASQPSGICSSSGADPDVPSPQTPPVGLGGVRGPAPRRLPKTQVKKGSETYQENRGPHEQTDVTEQKKRPAAQVVVGEGEKQPTVKQEQREKRVKLENTGKANVTERAACHSGGQHNGGGVVAGEEKREIPFGWTVKMLLRKRKSDLVLAAKTMGVTRHVDPTGKFGEAKKDDFLKAILAHAKLDGT